MTIKQVIVMAKYLKMQRGKEIAQGSHASMEFLSEKLQRSFTKDNKYSMIELSKAEQDWLTGNFAKVCLQINSEQELLDLHKAALGAGLTSHLIQDSGKTVFHGKPTYTCLAIGPDYAEKIDPITKHLLLY